MTERPLHERARDAADTLEDMTRRYFRETTGKDFRETTGKGPEFVDWRPVNLRDVADQFEQEDAESAAVRRQLINLIHNRLRTSIEVVDDILSHFTVTPKDNTQ